MIRQVGEVQSVVEQKEEPVVVEVPKKENKKVKKEDMLTKDDFNKVESAVNNLDPTNVKVVKKDRGLIERTESSKIVLTEDNRQVLND